MSEHPDHNAPFPNKHHGLPEDAPNSPNPYEEDDLANKEGEIPRKRDDSSDDKEDPYESDSK
ncbi:hypothetical protein CYR40_09175 [Chimaeribacter arupi]|uniref:Uncharacterized protein n=2 Tax=Yersiniaceae TaxID=1903411 RepID=A0A2N5ELQ7_9GAMM|nr:MULTISPECIES: hypothetical protein [Yersiniaceae]MBS0967424.1 hypothetical protein [Nissabacter archeti]MDV5141515.1 hypothetical protein [Chimaeribacter arupi]PLR34572.1 hypothetical protein CYR23_10490 [Chimaeribacter arupi]PLR46540.1 hypothetical protein CYR52_15500 [Chimaeribacter arupi]PLR47292.1 hypothetical protein CYR40_09175 [Chimaeribacter arupi]